MRSWNNPRDQEAIADHVHYWPVRVPFIGQSGCPSLMTDDCIGARAHTYTHTSTTTRKLCIAFGDRLAFRLLIYNISST